MCCRQPKWYGERMRRKIQAGAGVENLRLRCPYFYDVALLLHSIERGPPLAEFAMKTFQARYRVSSPPHVSTDFLLAELSCGCPGLLTCLDHRHSLQCHSHKLIILTCAIPLW